MQTNAFRKEGASRGIPPYSSSVSDCNLNELSYGWLQKLSLFTLCIHLSDTLLNFSAAAGEQLIRITQWNVMIEKCGE